MKNYKCIANLTRKLSDAADEVIARADNYEGIGPYRVLISDLTDDYGVDERYVPLLVDMLNERTGVYEIEIAEIEIIDDEIFLHHRSLLAQSISPDRLGELLDNALTWIGGMVSGSDLYNTFKNSIGMCDEEMVAAGYVFDEHDTDENPGITMQ